MDFGNIHTNIIKNGLVFNMDAANRASTIPSTSTTTTFNTLNTSLTGTFNDGAGYDSSTISPSFQFDGADGDKINLSSTISSLTNVSQFSLSTWVYWNTTGNTNEWIFMQASTNNANRVQFELYNQDLYFKFANAQGSVSAPSAAVDMVNSAWVNITATFNVNNVSADRMIVYLNGSRASNTSYTAPDGNTNADFNYTTIGGRKETLYGFNGNIANFNIYNRALSANEVLHNYNALKSRFGL